MSARPPPLAQGRVRAAPPDAAPTAAVVMAAGFAGLLALPWLGRPPGPADGVVLALAVLLRHLLGRPAGRGAWVAELAAWGLTALAVALALMLQGRPAPPAALLAYAGGGMVLQTLLARGFARLGWRRRPRPQRVAVVGAGEQGRRLVARLLGVPGVRIVGIYDERRERVPASLCGLPLAGDLEELARRVRREEVDAVLIALPLGARGRIEQWLRRLRRLPVDVRLALDAGADWLEPRRISALGPVPLLHLYDHPLRGRARHLKSALDRTVALLGLVLTAPLLLVVALAVKLSSPGPVLYRQRRWGFAGEPIEVLKFRTFHHHACRRGDDPALPHAGSHHPDLTPLGRFLRRWSLDELPQLWNVLVGDMSLVGPRPHAVAHDEHYARLVGDYLARLKVKPGLTGWAQINGARGEIRSLAEMERRVALDLDYIENWSFWWDLEILLRTLLVGWRDPRG